MGLDPIPTAKEMVIILKYCEEFYLGKNSAIKVDTIVYALVNPAP
jgi:hypothetical protein